MDTRDRSQDHSVFGSLVDDLPLDPALARRFLIELTLSLGIEAPPTRSLATDLAQESVETLRTVAREAGIKGSVSRFKKQTLVSKLCEKIVSSPEDLITFVCKYGTDYLLDVKRLIQAGGRIDLPLDSISSPDDLIAPHEPVTFLYVWEGTASIVVPNEVLAALRNADWEKEYERLLPIERAIDYFDLAVDLRGLVDFDEAYAELSVHSPDVPSKRDIEDLILAGMTGQNSAFAPHLVLDIPSLVHGRLIEDDGPYGSETYTLDERLEDLQYAQSLYPARPIPSELMEAGNVLRLYSSHNALRNIESYVQNNLTPKEDNPFALAEVTASLILDSRDSQSATLFFDSLRRAGFEPTEAQADELIALHAVLMAHIPRWDKNGWSLADELMGKIVDVPYEEAELIPFSPANSGEQRAQSDGQDLTSDSLASVLPFSSITSQNVLDQQDTDTASGTVDANPHETSPDEAGKSSGESSGESPKTNEDAAFEEYERRCGELTELNEGYLHEFDEWLDEKGLSDKTITRHITNVDFFLNYFLQYSDAIPMEEGVGLIGDFLGDWFIRKAMWSTPATVRQSATSLKKFYQCMHEYGHIGAKDLAYVLEDIKSGTPQWADACGRYNAGDSDWYY